MAKPIEIIETQPQFPPDPTPADEARAKKNWDEMPPSRQALIRKIQKKSAQMVKASMTDWQKRSTP